MKKFIKYTAVLGLLLTVLGFGVAWAASRSGAGWDRQPTLYSLFRRGAKEHHHDLDDEGVIEKWIREEICGQTGEQDRRQGGEQNRGQDSGSAGGQTGRQSSGSAGGQTDRWSGEWIDGDTICFPMKKELEIDLGRGQLTIQPGDVEKIQITCEQFAAMWDRRISLEEDGDSLEIYVSGADGKKASLEIVIPRDAWFQEVQISMAAGNCVVGGINTEELAVYVAAGSMEIQQGNVSELDAQCGAGNIQYTGRLTGDADVQCAAGSIELYLDEKDRSFNYSLEGAGGSIHVGEFQLDGLLFERHVDNGATKEMDLECAAGSILVEFLGEDM